MTGALPSREDCVLRYVLDRWAEIKPKQTFCIFEDDTEWTYRETQERTRRLGAALQAAGVGEGDHVVVWLPNGKECLEAYFALGIHRRRLCAGKRRLSRRPAGPRH